jgi:hypothetical protein
MLLAIGGASKHDLFLWPLETHFEFCSFGSFLFFFFLFPFYCVLCLLSLPRFHHFRIVVEHSRLIVGQFLTTIFATNILKLGVVTQNILKSKGFFFGHKVCTNPKGFYISNSCAFSSAL